MTHKVQDDEERCSEPSLTPTTTEHTSEQTQPIGFICQHGDEFTAH